MLPKKKKNLLLVHHTQKGPLTVVSCYVTAVPTKYLQLSMCTCATEKPE